MNYISKLQDICEKACKLLDMQLKSVEWEKRNDNYFVSVTADSSDGMDIEKATNLNGMISDELDKQDFIKEDYMIEVSSPGVEPELHSELELKNNVGEFVHIDFIEKESIEKLLAVATLEGYLREVGDTLKLEINLKGRIKKVNVNRDNIKLIRKAIKF